MATFDFDGIGDLMLLPPSGEAVQAPGFGADAMPLSFTTIEMDQPGVWQWQATRIRLGIGFSTPVARRWDPDVEQWVPLTPE